MTRLPPFLDSLGWDRSEIARRLDCYGLVAADHALACQLQARVIRQQLRSLVRVLYASMREHHAFRSLAAGTPIPTLVRAATQYLLTLGVDFDTEGYFETRARVGATRIEAESALPLFGAAASGLQRALVPVALERDGGSSLAQFVLKITALDLSLATDGYHLGVVAGLRHSMTEMQGQTRALRRSSSFDVLTGLGSRAQILAALHAAQGGSDREGREVCVVMADLD